ncbi:hypothetical protein Tco_1156442 [Tanacetum coccineum]
MKCYIMTLDVLDVLYDEMWTARSDPNLCKSSLFRTVVLSDTEALVNGVFSTKDPFFAVKDFHMTCSNGDLLVHRWAVEDDGDRISQGMFTNHHDETMSPLFSCASEDCFSPSSDDVARRTKDCEERLNIDGFRALMISQKNKGTLAVLSIVRAPACNKKSDALFETVVEREHKVLLWTSVTEIYEKSPGVSFGPQVNEQSH